MLIDRRNFARHRPWVAFTLAATLAASAWFVAASRGQAGWPGGGSLPGLTFGVLGGLMILFEFALWGRKKLRSWRIGRVQTWMIAHIWLGLLSVPLIVFHCGFRWGGSLSAVLMALFLGVIASGAWGLALQQVLPRMMLDQVPAETIHSQIGRQAGFLAEEARRLVASTCGLLPGEDPVEDEAEARAGAPISFLIVGAVQDVGDVRGKVLLTRSPRVAVPGSEPLREAFRSTIRPYLLEGAKGRSPLGQAARSAAIFHELRRRLPPGAREAAEILEGQCDQRRQLDRQDRLHRWLHNWLGVHVPLSIALVVLMFAHAYVALKYR